MMIKDSSLITHHSSLSLKAPAKINWFLNILGLRDDGFHEIQSLMQKITLYDVLTFAPSMDLELETDSVIPVEQNLVYKAAILLKNTCGTDKGAFISLNKNIPVGAGLGGGSSNAASALLGLNELWSLDLSTEDLCIMAGQLGSDVPFFLCGAISLSHGRGEKITPCNTEKTVNLLLVKPPFSVSTAWAYGEYKNRIQDSGYRRQNTGDRIQETGDRFKNVPTSQLPNFRTYAKLSELTKKANIVDNIEFLIRLIERTEFRDITDIVSNDLESVTIKSFPVISEIKDRLIKQGAIFSLMSGSGPTVFGVFRSAEEAENASKAFKGYWTTVVQTMTE
ncbi:MAG: 4-(cytidine 5'-diphospho)-2-C-methyl-D-erythritol kinase [Nitrospirae bacterium]|nr:4-(cytidine 5'-diphospho)-2-C-methyl-D-erythritol kinase [Nitrospirota bacterium]